MISQINMRVLLSEIRTLLRLQAFDASDFQKVSKILKVPLHGRHAPVRAAWRRAVAAPVVHDGVNERASLLARGERNGRTMLLALLVWDHDYGLANLQELAVTIPVQQKDLDSVPDDVVTNTHV